MDNSFIYISKNNYKEITNKKKHYHHLDNKILLGFLIKFIFLTLFFNFICFIIIKKHSMQIKNKISNNIIEKISVQNDSEDNIYLDRFQTYIYHKIQKKLSLNRCCQMWSNQREFLNGIVRKFRPKKIVEIGVAKGGGSSIILNAIQDEGAHLYSIDLSNNKTYIFFINKKISNLTYF